MKNTDTKKQIFPISWKICSAAIAMVLLQTAFSFAQCTVTVNSPGTTTVCSGDSIGLYASFSPCSGAVSYSWSPGGNTTSSILIYSATTTTTYTVIACCSNTSCCDTATITVTVKPVPVITISKPSTICGTTTLCASGGTNYYWYTSPGQTTACITVNLTVPTIYYVSGLGTNGCYGYAMDTISPALTFYTGTTPASCNGNNGTAATYSVSGNAPPFTYAWSNGQTTATATGLPAGAYTITVTDANGCTATGVGIVTQSNGLIIAVVTNGSAGTATANASGGTAPYTYVWNTSPTQNSQTATGLVPGTYVVNVTDANGCTGSHAFVMGNSACSNRDFENGDFSNFTGLSGRNPWNGTITWSGGLVQGPNDAPATSSFRHTILTVNALDPLTIDPLTGQPDVFMTTLAPNGGKFSVRLGNTINGSAGGCCIPNTGGCAEGLKTTFSVTASDTVFTYQFAGVYQDPAHTLVDQPGFMVNVYDASGQKIANLSQTIFARSPLFASNPFIVSTNTLGNTPIVYRRWQGQSINLTPYVGQTVTIEFANFDCAQGGHMGYTYLDGSCFGKLIANVWPGDCDYDLYANYVDVLSIGLAYFVTGPTRSGASNNWVAQPCTDWATSFTLGANHKHVDCNGDGAVDVNDTLAISLNYGNNHPFKLVQPVYTTALPDLYLVSTVDSVGPNTLVNVDIMLGKNTKPVDSIYGLAFSIIYDPTYFLNAFNTGAGFATSWLGTLGTDMISFRKNLFSSGQLDLALTRTDHSNVLGGSGKIGTFTFRTTPVTSVGPGNIQMTISGLKAVTATGRVVSLNATGDSVYFDPNRLGISSYLDADLISVFPNPASKDISVTLPSGLGNVSIELINVIGQNLMTITDAEQTIKLDVSSVPAGIYQMKISCNEGVAVKKIQVSRK